MTKGRGYICHDCLQCSKGSIGAKVCNGKSSCVNPWMRNNNVHNIGKNISTCIDIISGVRHFSVFKRVALDIIWKCKEKRKLCCQVRTCKLGDK